jgi:hypothetical protein
MYNRDYQDSVPDRLGRMLHSMVFHGPCLRPGGIIQNSRLKPLIHILWICEYAVARSAGDLNQLPRNSTPGPAANPDVNCQKACYFRNLLPNLKIRG